MVSLESHETMRKKRNQYLLISLVILSLASALIFLFSGESKPEVDKDLFKIQELEKIDAVTLTSPGRSISLKYDGSRWRVNDTWDADGQMIKVLFATLRQAEPRRPVSAALRDSVRHRLEGRGVRVILSEDGAERSAFMVGGNDLKTEAWFMKADDPQPYVMSIPGYRVYVGGVFELDLSGWRNKRVFDFNWRNFRSLTATYPKEPGQGFEIGMRDGSFGVRDLETADTARLNTYLDEVSLLFATRYVEKGLPSVDSLVSAEPAARIEIRDIANRTYSLDLFTPLKSDPGVYGRLADGELVLLDKSKVAEIVRRKDYFRAQPGR